ncbi:MAG: hypothetical protein ACFFDN_36305, partial [Candidatus Hodarchaeota archaeon]
IGGISSAVVGFFVLYKKEKITFKKGTKFKKRKTATFLELKAEFETKEYEPKIKPQIIDKKQLFQKEERPKIKKLATKSELTEFERIQNLEKGNLTDSISKFREDLSNLLQPTHPMVIEVKEWIDKVENYPLSKLTKVDAEKLSIAINKWKKMIQLSSS